MFGFGEDTTTETKTTSVNRSLPSWLEGAASGNIAALENLRNTGYTPYGGDRVAGLSGDEETAGGMIRAVAGSDNPYRSILESVYGSAATTAPGQISGVPRLIDDVGPGGSTAAYMDPYWQQAIQPVLDQIGRDEVANRQRLDRGATMAGAFGDARHGIEGAGLTESTSRLKGDVTRQAASQAYSDAMRRKEADIARRLDVDKANIAAREGGLDRALPRGGAALQGLDKYETSRELDLAKNLGQFGSVVRGLDQKQLDALYEEFSKKTGWPLEVSKQLIAAISGVAPSLTDTTSTETISKPDNSGFGLLGTLGGALGSTLLGPAGTALGTYAGNAVSNWLSPQAA